ncbi:hypothetical protein BRD08_09050 [Halobacteriales archaeon SW_10_66_29]|nr:MAG: hypothetical protein BRD08_09050 [Halobacteriales archaeon SW_10_66_29]
MATATRVNVDETTREELLALLDHEEEVGLDAGGSDLGLSVTLRKRGGNYYCDTSVKLYSFESRDALCTRLKEFGIPSATRSA